jgi:hypothetical protein
MAADLWNEITASRGSGCIAEDSRAIAISISGDPALDFCYSDVDRFPEVKRLLEFVDALANRSFGSRYAHTFTKGPTALQRWMAGGYGCHRSARKTAAPSQSGDWRRRTPRTCLACRPGL